MKLANKRAMATFLILIFSLSTAKSFYIAGIKAARENPSAIEIDVNKWQNHEISVHMIGTRKTLYKQNDIPSHLALSATTASYSSCNLTVATPNAPVHGGILAEPHKSTRFVLSLVCDSGTNPSNVILTSYGSSGQKAKGHEFNMTFRSPGSNTLTVYACLQKSVVEGSAAPCTPSNSIKEFNTSVAVTYVRREVRSLTPDERQRYFNAIKTLKKYSTADGQEIYGDKFYSYGEFIARHMAVSWGFYGQCNMGHNGPAFLPFHRAFVRQFELAIQSIDPTLSSVYWDYVADSTLEDPSDSEIWGEDLYGDMVGDSSDKYQVKNGQFANWTIPYGDEAQALSQLTWGTLGPVGVVNPYGYLRSPEVNNPAPYITRMGNVLSESLSTTENWVGCNNYTYLGDVINCLEKLVHVTAHDIVGGLTGLPEFADVKSDLNCSQFDNDTLCESAFDEYKVYGIMVRSLGVRDGCIVCDKECTSIDEDPTDCSCTCINPAPQRCSAYFVMQKFFSSFSIPAGYEFAGYGLCTPSAYVGDYADVAASVNDPIFWPHHTNADRVFSSWRKLNPTGAWENMNFTYPSTDNSQYPDKFSPVNIIEPGVPWPGVLPPGDGNPTGVCEGHGLWDATLRASFTNLFRSIGDADVALTNLNLLESVDVELKDPLQADYIYDKYYAL